MKGTVWREGNAEGGPENLPSRSKALTSMPFSRYVPAARPLPKDLRLRPVYHRFDRRSGVHLTCFASPAILLTKGAFCPAGGYVALLLDAVGTGLLYESPAGAIAAADKCQITPTTALVAGVQ